MTTLDELYKKRDKLKENIENVNGLSWGPLSIALYKDDKEESYYKHKLKDGARERVLETMKEAYGLKLKSLNKQIKEELKYLLEQEKEHD